MGITLNRSCGGCTACCKTHAVFEIKKPTGKWCPHCDTSRGCSIYPNHPRACKDFKCAWLRGFGEDGNRPDCTKIILDFHVTDALIKILQIWEVNGGTLRGSFAKESAQLALENGIAVILIAAKIASLVEKIGQPAVLGELVMGVILGNLFLLGLHIFEPIKNDSIIAFLSELGVVILLFQIGLESNIEKMKKVGVRAFLVACVGVVVPFALGVYLVGPLFLPGADFNSYLFIGATLTATSVGITARVLKDLGKLQLPESKIILGAAVIDDVMGLVILAVVSGIIATGALSLLNVGVITLKSVAFLIGAIVVGTYTAPWIGRQIAKMNVENMKIITALIIAFIFSSVKPTPAFLEPLIYSI